jgi:hypothetical protein
MFPQKLYFLVFKYKRPDTLQDNFLGQGKTPRTPTSDCVTNKSFLLSVFVEVIKKNQLPISA